MGCAQSQSEIDARESSSNNNNASGAAANANNSASGSSRGANQQYRGRALNNNAGAERAAGSRSNGASNSTSNSMSMRIQYLQNQNVETIVQGKFTGEGIKKTPAYETPLSKHDLDKWRKDFWDTRTSGAKHIWNCIKSSCEETADTAQALILAADLQMPQNSLTLCIDETGVYYRVPICVINDPINYDADFQTQKLKSKEQPNEIRMKLKVRHAAKGDVLLEFSNLIQVDAFKQMYIDKLGANGEGIKVSALRMFAMGKELKDELFIYSYDIIDESTVQVMIAKAQPE